MLLKLGCVCDGLKCSWDSAGGRAGFFVSDKPSRCDAVVHRSTRKVEEEGGLGVSQASSWRQLLWNQPSHLRRLL